MDSNEVAARQLLATAAELECEQRYDEAVRALRRAYKLCPKLEHENGDDSDDDAWETQGGGRFTRMPSADSGFRTFPLDALYDPARRRELLEFFDAYGYVVVDNALNPDEVAAAKGMWERFMAVYDCDVHSKESLEIGLADAGKGFAWKGGIGQSTMSWYVRSRGGVKDAFRTVLFGDGAGVEDGAKKMITSFDGWNYFRNPEVGGEAWGGTKTSWFHFDADDRTNCNYVQGIVNLMDCTDPADPGLVLLPKSHRTVFPHVVSIERREHPAYITHMEAPQRAVYATLDVRETAHRVPLHAGALVLWKSNVMHCNTGCLVRDPPRRDPAQLIRRLVCYVCMQPDPNDDAVAARRMQAFADGLTSSHHPDLCRCSCMTAPSDAARAAGVVVTDVDALPEGAAELL